MGLFDVLFGKVEQPAPAPDKPKAVAITPVDHGVYAICSGQLMPMADIPDPVFASGAMGMAVGIKPEEGVIYAPVSGTITLTTGTLHAVGLTSDEGIGILIHVGVDTVNMKGDGFYGFVEKGQHVSAGEPLMIMDLDKIAEAGYSDVAIIVITNTNDYAAVTPVTAGYVAAGEPVMTVEP